MTHQINAWHLDDAYSFVCQYTHIVTVDYYTEFKWKMKMVRMEHSFWGENSLVDSIALVVQRVDAKSS